MNQTKSLARTAKNVSVIFLIVITCFVSGRAQVAAGGNYTLEQSVIASGGGAAANGTYKIEGTIGQSVAGTDSSNSPFTLRSGFFTPESFAPTAANVSISGRVLTKDGRGVRNVRLSLTEADGTVRTILSGTFGYYRFTDISVGQTVILNLSAKRFVFNQPIQVLHLTEDLTFNDFVAFEQ